MRLPPRAIQTAGGATGRRFSLFVALWAVVVFCVAVTAAASTAVVSPGSTTPQTALGPVPVPADYDGPPLETGGVGTTVGTARYPAPTDAVVVSPTGDDTASGRADSPLRTIARAIERAGTGAVVVLRGGQYHESLVVPSSKRLTIQSWPGEAVWLDGSQPVGGWVPDGAQWRRDGWTVEFDASPTYTRGAADNTQAGWGFVDPAHPMAAHPDQVWIDGSPQRQVGSRAAVTAGTFFHDRAADRLYLGTNPTGRSVRASTLSRALRVLSDHSVVRGIGFRRYAPSVPDIGAVIAEGRDIVFEHLAVEDSATTGMSVVGTGGRVRNVSIRRSGMLGMHANYADGLVVERILSEDNNRERFNTSPVAGGMKATRSRSVTVRDSAFRANHGTGLWLDESVHDIVVTGSEFRSNARHGTSLELSAKAVFADNLVTGNGGHGLKINNTSDTKVWNNTFVGNGRPINLVQDVRRPGNAPGRDPRQPVPDPTMTWLNGPAVFANNVLASPQSSANCLLCVEDYSKERTAEQMGVTADSDVYNRVPAGSPRWLAVWSRGASDPAVFTDLPAFRAATGQERNGIQVEGTPVVDRNGVPSSAMPPATTARPLPADIAALIGRPTGDRHFGRY